MPAKKDSKPEQVRIVDKNGNTRTYCELGEVKVEMRLLLKARPDFSPFTALDADGKEIEKSETAELPTEDQTN